MIKLVILIDRFLKKGFFVCNFYKIFINSDKFVIYRFNVFLMISNNLVVIFINGCDFYLVCGFL